MEIATNLRQLWRLRRVVVVVGIGALIIGTAVAYRISFPPKLESRKHQVGIATTRILVDTPNSQLVAVAPRGSDALGVRANLIANLMVDGEVKTAIASHAGLRPDQLGAIAQPVAPGAPPPAGARAYELTTRVMTNANGGNIPVIEIQAQAPDAARAARLANAAVIGLRDYVNSKARSEPISNARRLRVSGLGAPQISEMTHGPSPLIALGAAILVFGAGCAIILLVLSILPTWRLLVEIDELESLSAQAVAANGGDPALEMGEPAAHVNEQSAGTADQRT